MKNHLKRIASPRTWIINRKQNVYITRPKPGAHKMEAGLPLGVILRDDLKLAATMAEAKKVLHNNDILVDGKRRKDYRYIVGLFDVISIPKINKSYRVIFNKKGKILFIEIDQKEANFKVCQIVGKTVLAKGKIQLNLHDGKNILSDTPAKVGDSVLLSLPDLKIKELLPLTKGATVFLTKGKHAGDVGSFKEFQAEDAIYVMGEKEIETARKYIFVIGKDTPLMEIKN